MRTTALLFALVLAPTSALADVEFEDSATHDCGADPVVNISKGGGTYTFTGACKQVNVNGSDVTVTIETVDELNVNGTKNKITAAAVGAINVNGTKNSIKWKATTTGKKKPAVAVNGKGNAIAKIK